jgi:hypothetical protein
MSNGTEKTAPGALRHQGPDTPLAHRRPGYSLSGCVPAEPDFVSPGDTILPPIVDLEQPTVEMIGHTTTLEIALLAPSRPARRMLPRLGYPAEASRARRCRAWGSAPNPGIFGGTAPMSNGTEKTAPGALRHQGPDTPLAHRRPGYPLSGCVPAEPDSVSPGDVILPRIADLEQPPLDIGAIPLKIPGVWGRSLPGASPSNEPRPLIPVGRTGRGPGGLASCRSSQPTFASCRASRQGNKLQGADRRHA